MRKGEIAIFTVPPKIAHGVYDIFPSIPFGSNLQFEVELISWLKVVDVCGDGGIMKKILSTSEILERAQKKDEVTGIHMQCKFCWFSLMYLISNEIHVKIYNG